MPHHDPIAGSERQSNCRPVFSFGRLTPYYIMAAALVAPPDDANFLPHPMFEEILGKAV